ncbi:hypothetical protein AB0H51_28250 [Streptomyces griseoluteus]|uniref:hypothetical protein n=1 Tax=Streptomyces griseoluteus TaxID=29306 RepID=UPI0033EAB396
MSAPLKHKGRPVPYIAAWTAEHVPLPRLRVESGALAIKGQRRAAGVLWKPWRARPGVGEPVFADVHGPRQRECMLRMWCQVCRRPVVRNELGWPWLIEADWDKLGWPEGAVTAHPPTCEDCQPVAAIQCTPNRGLFVSLRVGQVLADGVYGQLYRPAATGAPVKTGKNTVVFPGNRQLRWMLGGQAAATLVDVTVVDMRTQAPVSRQAVSR